MHEQELEKHFVFDQADLEANRQGQLTDKQIKYLAEDVKDTRIVGWGCSAVFFIIALIVLILSLVAFIRSGQSFDGAALQSLVPTLTLAGILGIAGLMMALWTLTRSGAKSNASLKKEEGPINIVAVERRVDLKHPVYIAHELHIGHVSFDVKADLANLMQQGDRYAIYYTQGPDGSEKLIQSVERLSAA